MRVAEVETTLETLGVLSSGEAISNVRSAFQPTFDSRAWQNTLDTGKDVIMAGHSFGSATTISCLRTPGTQKVFSKGICLDPVGIAAVCVVKADSSSAVGRSAR